MRRSGASARLISEYLGTGHQTVRRRLIALAEWEPRRAWTSEQERMAIDLRREGASTYAIGKATGTAARAVRPRLIKLGEWKRRWAWSSWSPRDERIAVEMHRSGENATSIGEALGINASKIRYRLVKIGEII